MFSSPEHPGSQGAEPLRRRRLVHPSKPAAAMVTPNWCFNACAGLCHTTALIRAIHSRRFICSYPRQSKKLCPSFGTCTHLPMPRQMLSFATSKTLTLPVPGSMSSASTSMLWVQPSIDSNRSCTSPNPLRPRRRGPAGLGARTLGRSPRLGGHRSRCRQAAAGEARLDLSRGHLRTSKTTPIPQTGGTLLPSAHGHYVAHPRALAGGGCGLRGCTGHLLERSHRGQPAGLPRSAEAWAGQTRHLGTGRAPCAGTCGAPATGDRRNLQATQTRSGALPLWFEAPMARLPWKSQITSDGYLWINRLIQMWKSRYIHYRP